MTKQEFVERVAQKSGLGRREAGEAVDAVIDSITEALKNGEEVSFTGFGKVSTQHRSARQGVSARNTKFSAGGALKRADQLRTDAAKLEDERDAFHAELKEPLKTLDQISR